MNVQKQYIGARYVPKFSDPIEWSNKKSYEALTIVTHEGNSYTSKKPVPINVGIDNTEYWVLTSNYNAQMNNLLNQYQESNEYFEAVSQNFSFTRDCVKGCKVVIVSDNHTVTEPVINILRNKYPLSTFDTTHISSQLYINKQEPLNLYSVLQTINDFDYLIISAGRNDYVNNYYGISIPSNYNKNEPSEKNTFAQFWYSLKYVETFCKTNNIPYTKVLTCSSYPNNINSLEYSNNLLNILNMFPFRVLNQGALFGEVTSNTYNYNGMALGLEQALNNQGEKIGQSHITPTTLFYYYGELPKQNVQAYTTIKKWSTIIHEFATLYPGNSVLNIKLTDGTVSYDVEIMDTRHWYITGQSTTFGKLEIKTIYTNNVESVYMAIPINIFSSTTNMSTINGSGTCFINGGATGAPPAGPTGNKVYMVNTYALYKENTDGSVDYTNITCIAVSIDGNDMYYGSKSFGGLPTWTKA